MPKIIVREKDNTKVGSGLYTNFSVLVPGTVAIQDSPVFDENGVYECSSVADFNRYIGRDKSEYANDDAVAAIDPDTQDLIHFVATPCVANLTADTEVVEGKSYYRKSEEPNEEKASKGGGYLCDSQGYEYTLVPDEDKEPQVPETDGEEEEEAPAEPTPVNPHEAGWFELAKDADDNPIVGQDAEQAFDACFESLGSTEKLCLRTENKTSEIGYCKSADYIYVIITSASLWDADAYEGTDKYFAILDDADLGEDATKAMHHGNQIAYQLLKLGYTVLFKKFDDITELNSPTFWEPLKDKSIYDFRYVVSGFIGYNKADEQIAKLAYSVYKNEEKEDNGRGDCTALIDLPEKTYAGKKQADAVEAIRTELNKKSGAGLSGYVAYFAPYVDYNLEDSDKEVYNNTIFPAYFHYLACAAKAAEYYNEWYAIAGYTLGTSNLSIKGVGCKFGDQAINILQPRYRAAGNKGVACAVNLIKTVKDSYYLWGSRTAKALGAQGSDESDLKASHFLNIRQLCSSIKKQIYATCRKYTFRPNSDLLWGDFCADIRPLLEKMKGDQGITDYSFTKVKVQQKALLKAIIRIVPVEPVEDFDITLTLEDSLSGILIDDDEIAA